VATKDLTILVRSSEVWRSSWARIWDWYLRELALSIDRSFGGIVDKESGPKEDEKEDRKSHQLGKPEGKAGFKDSPG